MKTFKEMLSTFQAAEKFGVTHQTIRRWIHLGKMKGIRHPVNKREILIHPDEIDRILKELNK